MLENQKEPKHRLKWQCFGNGFRGSKPTRAPEDVLGLQDFLQVAYKVA